MGLSYDPVTDLYSWPTGANEPLGKHFNTSEFESKDPHCSIQYIRGKLILLLDEVRDEVGEGIYINDGYRTLADQDDLRAKGYPTSKGPSTHEKGWAADVRCRNMPALLAACKKRFKAIGVAARFLHVDLRDDKERRWIYA